MSVNGNSRIVGILLAGGLSRRMGGGDKCLRMLAGKPILDHVINRIRPQVSALALSANGDPARFASYQLPVLPDVIPGFAGPLAGVLTGLEWARETHHDAEFLLSVPTDAPFLPGDLAPRMLAQVTERKADMACAASGGRAHPVVGLWPTRLLEALREAVRTEEIRKVDIWTARYRLADVAWPTEPHDPFFNANRLEDVAEAERILRG